MSHRHRAPYTYAEVELLYLTPRSPENAERLAVQLGRNRSAIEWAWRWVYGDVERFPERAFGNLYSLVCQVRARHGGEARGSCPPTGASEVA